MKAKILIFAIVGIIVAVYYTRGPTQNLTKVSPLVNISAESSSLNIESDSPADETRRVENSDPNFQLNHVQNIDEYLGLDESIRWTAYNNSLEWWRSKGFYSDEETATYIGYSPQTLVGLARTGDVIAMEKLGDLVFENGAFDEAERHYLTAAAYGSVATLEKIAGMYASTASTLRIQGDIDGMHENLMTASAFHQVAAMRGYPWAILAGDIDLKINKVEFSLDEVSMITEQANSIFEALRIARDGEGLDEFDNSVSRGTELVSNEVLNSRDSLGTWGSHVAGINSQK